VQKTSGITDVLGYLTDLTRVEASFAVGVRIHNKDHCLLYKMKSEMHEEVGDLWWESI